MLTASDRGGTMVRTSKCIALFAVILVLLLVATYVVLEPIQNSDTLNAKRPHIVVIVADDLGWNDVSFHGADQIPTPNIDALAFNGVILQRHYVLPTCTPSRTAFLTGRYPIRTGMQGYPLKAGEPRAIPLENTLLPEHLRGLGYATHLVGKWHVGYYANRYTPTYRGFDSFFGYYNGYVQYFNHTLLEDGHGGHDLHDNVGEKLSVAYDHRYLTDLISKRAEDVITRHDRTKPLYLQVAHLATHSSDSDQVMEVRDANEVNATLGYIENTDRRKFAGVLTALDESVGTVVDALKRANMLENSIIVFMSDNGAQTKGFLENFGSNYPLRGMKFTLFEGGIRGVACVYSSLIEQRSRISSELFHVTDWLPTLYSAAGGNLEDLKQLDGVDQWTVLTSGRKTDRRKILLNIDEVGNSSAAIIGRYKLIKGAAVEDGGYYGDSGTNSSYPAYDVRNVFQSPAGVAIANVSGKTLEPMKIRLLRKEATVLCDRPTDYPSCKEQCLFDIYKDPCGTTDLAPKYPTIVDRINTLIEGYREVLVNQTNAPVDPASYPENFNGTWMPWIKIPSDRNCA